MILLVSSFYGDRRNDREFQQTTTATAQRFKGTGKRGHIVAHDVSWVRGHKMNVVFPCCANWETFVADTKCF